MFSCISSVVLRFALWCLIPSELTLVDVSRLKHLFFDMCISMCVILLDAIVNGILKFADVSVT
jgi:hypothetical protein